MIATLAACASLLASSPAECRCVPLSSDSAATERAGVVLDGRVVAVDSVSASLVVYTVVVDRWAKGEGRDTVEVTTRGSHGASCGLTLPRDRPIRIYGSLRDGQVQTTSCNYPDPRRIPSPAPAHPTAGSTR